LNNLNERTHNLREENDTDKHEEDTNKHFIPRNWEVITIPNSRKSCQSKVADNNSLSAEVLRTVFINPSFITAEFMSIITKTVQSQAFLISKKLVQIERRNECLAFFLIFLCVDVPDNKPPETSDEVSDHENDNNQSEDFVSVHEHVLRLESISPG
jgi:hypothetical protein